MLVIDGPEHFQFLNPSGTMSRNELRIPRNDCNSATARQRWKPNGDLNRLTERGRVQKRACADGPQGKPTGSRTGGFDAAHFKEVVDG